MKHRIVPRRALAEARRKAAAARAVVVSGPRQAGKSWLLQKLATELRGTYLTLDDPAELAAARSDPTGFVRRDERGPLLIDEVQRGGDPLVLAIKAAVDRSNDLGQYVLAGSTRFLSEPRLSESLAGRARFVDLWPLTQGEIDELPAGDAFVEAILAGAEAVVEHAGAVSGDSRADTFARVVRGGFPEAALGAGERERFDFFADYVRTVSQRDIRELSRMSERIELPTILRLLAARTAAELNVSNLANDAALGRDTTRRYLPLIEAILLLHRVPGWARGPTSRSKSRPKIHLCDSGLAAWLADVRHHDLRRPGHPLDGALLESFVVNELVRQTTWASYPAEIRHWRDRAGREVDVIVAIGIGRIVGIEVKAAVDVHAGDFRHLEYLRDQLGAPFQLGIVLHCGDRMRRFGDRLIAAPVSAVWAGR